MKQIPTHVGDPPKKLATEDKIEPLGSQRVRLESGQHEVTWLGHFIMPFGTRKCWSSHVLLHFF